MIKSSIKRIIQRFRSNRILNRIGSGRDVCFENPFEEIALKYVHGEQRKPGKYFAKHWGRNEYEVDFNSSSVVMGVMEGRQISKSRYNNYHLIESVYWKGTRDKVSIIRSYGHMANDQQIA